MAQVPTMRRSSPRLFVDRPLDSDSVILEGPEAHHALGVLRLKIGDAAVLFDGSGREAPAEIVEIARRRIRFRVGPIVRVDRELGRTIVLGVALPKGDRQRFLIEKCTELGVAEIVPLTTARSIAEATPGAVDRLKRYVIEASKQCERNRLMRIAEATPLATFLDHPPPDAIRWIADEQAAPDETIAMCGHPWEHAARVRLRVFLAVGPEGGWRPDETRLARERNWQPISLGSRVLRTETAAIALATWWSLRA